MHQIVGFQLAISPRHAPPGGRLSQQDAMVLHTSAQRRLWQARQARVEAMIAADGWAWLSVADGVSASPQADLASRSFLQVLHHTPSGMPARQLPARVRAARHDWQSRHCNARTWGASTTLASLVMQGTQVCAVNCGDSRIWRLRPAPEGRTQWLQISRDHTVWQQLVDDEQADADDRESYASIYHGLLHCLTLGDNTDTDAWPISGDADDEPATPPDQWLHVWHGEAQPGDVYVLATDGLHETLGDAALTQRWVSGDQLLDNLQRLRRDFLAAGTPDDCSVVAISLTSRSDCDT